MCVPLPVSHSGVFACKLFWLGRILHVEAWERTFGHEGLSDGEAERGMSLHGDHEAGAGNVLSAWEQASL